MATIDYKEKYEKAVQAAMLAKQDTESAVTVQTIEEIFPEIRESDDERIRKALIKYFTLSDDNADYQCCGVHYKDIVAWLEKQGRLMKALQISNAKIAELVEEKYNLEEKLKKQGEQKPVISNDALREGITHFGITQHQIDNWLKKYVNVDKQGEHNPTDKVEPKFHEGEWITNGDYTWKIVEVKSLNYILQSQDGNIVDDTISHVDEQFHSFTIEDAKDGDVLSYRDGQWCFIYKGIVTEDTFKYYALLSEKDITVNDAAFSLLTSCIIPATKEQRDTLFTKMKEAGYEWDAEHKQLKKIEHKSVWNEEDEKRISSILLSIEYCKEQYPNLREYQYDIDWLKSIRPQSQWKPSDKHYELEEFAKIVRCNLTGISKAVQELFEAKYLQLTGNQMYGGFKD